MIPILTTYDLYPYIYIPIKYEKTHAQWKNIENL